MLIKGETVNSIVLATANPRAMAMEGNVLWVTHQAGPNTVRRVNAQDGSLLESFSFAAGNVEGICVIGSNLLIVRARPTTSELYLYSKKGAQLNMVNVNIDAMADIVHMGGSVIAVGRSGGGAGVVKNVYFVDYLTGEILRDSGAIFSRGAIAYDGRWLYGWNDGTGEIQVIDPVSLTVVYAVPTAYTGTGVKSLVFDGVGLKLLHSGSSAIHTIR